jgi:hypothetical protein
MGRNSLDLGNSVQAGDAVSGCGHYTPDPSGICNACYVAFGASSVGRTCERCARNGRDRKIAQPNPDNWCPECLREAANFGSDDMDRMRVVDARQNNDRFRAHQGYMAKVEAGR